LKACCSWRRALTGAAPWLVAAGLVALGIGLAAPSLFGQFRGFQAASVTPPAPVELEAGEEIVVPLIVRIRPRYHINSHEPLEDYLIPTAVQWETPGVDDLGAEFPEPELVTYLFSDSPLSVFSGQITIRAKLRAPADYRGGIDELTGKLLYQACNDKSCLAPTSASFSVPVR